MKLYVDSDNKVRAVNSTTDTSLMELIINDKNNPFKDWSVAKICCYKVTVLDGEVTGYTPYVSSSLLDMVDKLGLRIDNVTPFTETKTAYIEDTEIVFENVPGGSLLVDVQSEDDPEYSIKRTGDKVIVSFAAPLECVTKVTITIM